MSSYNNPSQHPQRPGILRQSSAQGSNYQNQKVVNLGELGLLPRKESGRPVNRRSMYSSVFNVHSAWPLIHLFETSSVFRNRTRRFLPVANVPLADQSPLLCCRQLVAGTYPSTTHDRKVESVCSPAAPNAEPEHLKSIDTVAIRSGLPAAASRWTRARPKK